VVTACLWEPAFRSTEGGVMPRAVRRTAAKRLLGSTMKVFELRSFGLDALTLTERPEPKPGPGQVLLQMRAFSLNYRDLMVVKGLYNPKMRLPMTPLSDGVGTIAAVGEGVTRVKNGDRVAVCFMQDWVEGELTEAKGKSAVA